MTDARELTPADSSSELDYYCYLRTLDAEPVEAPALTDVLRALRLQLRVLVREPIWMIILVQSLLYLTLFAPLLDGIAATPSPPSGDAWHVLARIAAVLLAAIGLAVAVRTVQRASA